MTLDIERVLLPVWDQTAVRVYLQLAFCFPFDRQTSSPGASESHIRASLDRLSRQRPDFAARLNLDDQGRVWLERRPDDAIPFAVLGTDAARFFSGLYPTYEELRDSEFPPNAFIHPELAIDGALKPGCPVPAVQVQVSYIDGGLILWTNTHHSLMDGDGARWFIKCFAAQTCGEEIKGPDDVAPVSMRLLQEENTETDNPHLGDSLNEKKETQKALSSLQKPPSKEIKQVDRILVFRDKALHELREELSLSSLWNPDSGGIPSSYVALSALTWAHITKARVSEIQAKGTERVDPSSPAKMFTPVDWKKRAFQETAHEYFGNAVVFPSIQVPVGEVLAATSSSSSGDMNGISHLAHLIQQSISSVDEEYVAERIKAMEAPEEPQSTHPGIDPVPWEDLGVNTWRFLGAGSDWNIPGIKTSRPDAIRRVGGKIGSDKALILPMREAEGNMETGGVTELLVWLPYDVMDLLLQDKDYMRWVDHVVG